MSNQWLRLWHEMPSDPKWRTIARASSQRIGDVMSVFVHLLVAASTATERGRTQSFSCEDVASALDLETAQVEAIVSAMQCRVLDGDRLRGWDKRQPAREDGSAERARAWRAEQKAKRTVADSSSNAVERDRTQAERGRTQDTDEIQNKEANASSSAMPTRPPCPHGEIQRLYNEILPELPAAKSWGVDRERAARQRWAEVAKAENWVSQADGVAWFKRFFEDVKRDDFLMGRAPPGKGHEGWRCGVDYLLAPKGFRRVVEADGKRASSAGTSQREVFRDSVVYEGGFER